MGPRRLDGCSCRIHNPFILCCNWRMDIQVHICLFYRPDAGGCSWRSRGLFRRLYNQYNSGGGTSGPFHGHRVWVVYKGSGEGIEKYCKILMPALFILLLVLIVRSVTLEGAEAGLAFYMQPDFSKLTGEVFLAA